MNPDLSIRFRRATILLVVVLGSCLSAIAQPVNDAFASATLISGSSGSIAGSNVNATKEAGEPNHAGNAGGRSIWYRWTAPSNGTVSFNTVGSAPDTLLGAYTGSVVNALTQIAANDDLIPPDRSSAVTFVATAGTLYRIAVDGYNGASGSITLNWLYPVVNESVLSLTVTNYSALVIDADANNADPSYNRDRLRVESQIRSSNLSAAHQSTWVTQYRLLEGGGTPHPILGENGVTNVGYVFNLTNTFVLGASATVTNTNSVALKPVVRLNPYSTYAVEARVFRAGTFTGAQLGGAQDTYYHFTNTVSGDLAYNVIPVLATPSYARLYAVNTVPGKKSFQVNAPVVLIRYDDFNSPASPVSIPIRLDYQLVELPGSIVKPIKVSQLNTAQSVVSYTASTPNGVGSSFVNHTLDVEPAAGVQLDSVNKTYYVQVTVSHQDTPGGAYVTGNGPRTSSSRLLHFNGHLLFGAIDTIFESISNTPADGGIVAGGVGCTLNVDNLSGYVLGSASHRYGDNSPLSATLFANGNAALIGGSTTLTLQPPGPDIGTVAGVRFVRPSPMTLSTGGVTASTVEALLPAGMGWTSNTNSPIMNSSINYSGVSLGQNLAPAASELSMLLLAGTPVWVFEETKPLLTRAWNVTWEVNTGSFRMEDPGTTPRALYVRGDELNFLQANAASLAESDMWFKRSNEQYFRFVSDTVNYPFRIRTGPDSSARLDADYAVAPGLFFSHFPYGASVQWLGASSMSIRDDHFNPANSFLNTTTNVAMFQYLGCLDSAAGCPPNLSFALHQIYADNSRLFITPDGGLAAQGNLSAPTQLKWGEFNNGGVTNHAHKSVTFDRVGFHMPGVFLRGDQAPPIVTDDAHRPGVMLLSGVTTDAKTMDRPITFAYLFGVTDYGGMNFRVGTDGAKQGNDFLGGVASGPFQLTGRSKYYARWGGVSGIHEAVPGSFPASLQIYGYPFVFDNYGLSFLGSQVWESRTEGSTSVPYPSEFFQPFKELKFTCIGDLLKAEVPGNDGEKKLAYWEADFKTAAIKFKKMPGTECAPGGGKLVLGVKSWLSNIEDPFFGDWGINTNGHLISYAYGLTGVDSRLQPPNNIKLQGPSGEKYNFVPVSRSYLNNYADLPAVQHNGFANLAGKLDVPFFEDLKVHLQTGAKKTNDTDLIFLPGGWPDLANAWDVGGKHFFNTAATDPPFDTANRGFEGGSLATYRRVTPSGDLYAPRALRTWAEVVDFDLPLDWSTGTRSFKSSRSKTDPLVLLDIDQDVKYLSPQNAEINFGVKFKGLPQINLANIAFNELNIGGQLKGVAKAVTDAATAPIQDAVNSGFKALDGLLAPQLDAFLEPVLAAVVDPVIDQLYTDLVNAYAVAPDVATFKINADAIITSKLTGAVGSVRTKLKQDLIGLGVNPLTVNTLGEIDARITKLEKAIDGLVNNVSGAAGLFAKTAGKRTKAVNLVQNLIGELAPAHSAMATTTKVDAFLADAEQAFAQLELELNKRRDSLDAYHNLLNGGAVKTELADFINTQGTVIDNLTAAAATQIKNYFNGLNYPAGSPFTQLGPDAIKKSLRQKLRDQLYASTVVSGLQQKLRSHFYELDGQVRTLTDSLFKQANDVIVNLLTETLADLDLGFNKFLGPLDGIMQGSRIRGYAHIKGDSLNELRLDGTFRWSVPEEMEFGAWFRIRELNSKLDYGCTTTAGTDITEVSMGAENVPIGWISPDLKADLGFGFSLKDGGAGYRPYGFTGNLAITGGLNFEAFSIGGLKATVAVGGDQNYFAGAMENAVFGDFDVSGGIYFGRACSSDPIKFIDPEVGDVLGPGSFTGAYAFGEGWAPIFGSSCALKLSAGVGGGAFYFAEGPTFGGKMVLGVSGDALCLVHVKGRVSMVGSKTGLDADVGGLRYSGKGTIKGKAGSCPFCVKFSKSVKVTYDNGFGVKF